MLKLMLRGTELEYAEQGDGDPVVLVHGSASDYRTWQTQLDAFAKRYWTIASSRRYHWANEPVAAHPSVERAVGRVGRISKSLFK